MFKWNKQGLIFSPAGQYPWMRSHAQCPYSLVFEDFVRVYFSTREAYDRSNSCRSYGGFVDLDKANLKHVLRVSPTPVLDLGGVGEFDEFGAMPNSVVRDGNEFLLYYCGWTRAVSTPYSWEIGLAKSRDAERFVKVGRGPVIGPVLHEPFLHACPVVYRFDRHRWDMFYLSGVKWLSGERKMESQYLLMHATSRDGVCWARDGRPIIPPVVDYESQTSAAIVHLEGSYHMLFSYRYGLDFRQSRSRGYRIGYATSEDLSTWHRDDSRAGIEVSDEGWDSEMICYPHINWIDGRLVLFYCGNNFGELGFGYAEATLP